MRAAPPLCRHASFRTELVLQLQVFCKDNRVGRARVEGHIAMYESVKVILVVGVALLPLLFVATSTARFAIIRGVGVGGVGSLRLRPLFVPSTAVPSRPSRLFCINRSTDLLSLPLSLSLSLSISFDDDEAYAYHHGDASSTSPSASLRPKESWRDILQEKGLQ